MSRGKIILWGFLGTLLALASLVSLALAWFTYNRAYDGELAWQCLHTPTCVVESLPRSMRFPAEPPKPEDQKPAKH